MTHREQLAAMLDSAGVLWSDYTPDDKDGRSEWAGSMLFGNDNEDGPTLAVFDFDAEGKLIGACSFLDPGYEECEECGEFHEVDDEETDEPELKN